MKKLLFALSMFAFSTTVTFAQATPAPQTEQTAKPKKVKKAKKQTTMYECPMKCEEASRKAGKCSKCGMDLVAINPNEKAAEKPKTGHEGHNHEGHNH